MDRLTSTLSEFIAGSSYEGLPPAVVGITKTAIKDLLGVIVASSSAASGGQQLLRMAESGGGCPTNVLIPSGKRTSVDHAAFYHGGMAHALDYDDTLDDAAVHPSGVTIPAALALAASTRDVSGKDLIVAVACGLEVACRLGRAAGYMARPGRLSWMPSTVMGPLSSAASCSRIMRLDAGTTAHALSIAAQQSSGTLELSFSTGSIVRGLYGAFVARSGLTAALMAEAGITGPSHVLDGDVGLFGCFYDGDFDRSQILSDLGTRFVLADISWKPWPSCRSTHIPIGSALGIVQELDLRPDDIDSVEVHIGARGMKLCEPLDERRHPKTPIDAKFSIPYSVAVAICRRGARIRDFVPEALGDPQVLAMAERVSGKLDPSLSLKGAAATVVVRTRDGRSVDRHRLFARGHPTDPMSPAEIDAKFLDCLSHAAPSLSPQRGSEAIRRLDALDREPDLAEVLRSLCSD